jgi:positive regulator of sigma E activity
MERTGKIIAIHDQSMDVSIQPEAHCASCASRSSCHGDSEKAVISVPLVNAMQIGQSVELHMEESTLTKSALLAYLVPPVCLLIGAGLGDGLFHHDSISIIGAGIGLACGFFLVHRLSRLFSRESLEPTVCHYPQPRDISTRSPAP